MTNVCGVTRPSFLGQSGSVWAVANSEPGISSEENRIARTGGIREPEVEVMDLIGYPRIMHAAQRKVLRSFASALWNNSSIEVQAIRRHPETRKDMRAREFFNTSNGQPAVS